MQVLRFYIANSIWINAVVILYMFILTMAYVNYRRVRYKVAELLENEIKAHPRQKNFSVQLDGLDVKKPFLSIISGKLSFLPARYSIAKMEQLLNQDEEIKKLREGIQVDLT